jgi:protein-S-isoprenylcysteine O-methyltransferase Ste14
MGAARLLGHDAGAVGRRLLQMLVLVGVQVHCFVAGYLVVLWAMSVNAYLSQTVRIQTERGHAVVTEGPYAVLRTELEDRTLHAELSGYPDYPGRTRYRLMPGIW